jgi:hypothetical protein
MGGGVGFFCGGSTRLPASDSRSPISWLLAPWLLGSSQRRRNCSEKSGDSHFASILVVESREMRVDLLCRCFLSIA